MSAVYRPQKAYHSREIYGITFWTTSVVVVVVVVIHFMDYESDLLRFKINLF